MSKNYTFYRLIKLLLEQHPKEDIFLRNARSLGHPYWEIQPPKTTQTANQTTTIEVETNFFGLLGASSQLPSYIIDKLTSNQSNSEEWSLFFDFFNNYLLWLFFDSSSLKNYHRSFHDDFSDKISIMLFSLLGIHDKKIAMQYLRFAPLILSLRKPKYYIQKILQYNFNLKDKLSIVENIPHKIQINNKQKNKLGKRNNILGRNFVLGNTVTSYQSKIGIYIKDITYQEALKYLPNGKNHNDLKESVIFLTDNEFASDLYLSVKYDSRMKFVLGSTTHAKLGWGKILGGIHKSHYFMRMNLCQ